MRGERPLQESETFGCCASKARILATSNFGSRYAADLGKSNGRRGKKPALRQFARSGRYRTYALFRWHYVLAPSSRCLDLYSQRMIHHLCYQASCQGYLKYHFFTFPILSTISTMMKTMTHFAITFSPFQACKGSNVRTAQRLTYSLQPDESGTTSYLASGRVLPAARFHIQRSCPFIRGQCLRLARNVFHPRRPSAV
jgi:hypothetical protein